MMRLGLLAVLILGSLVVLGCGGGREADEPPEIRFGRDTCSRCGMIISEERFAGGLVADNGEQRVFDDIGEMVMTVKEEGLGSQRVWVHDYESAEWVDGTTAIYVATESVITPMGSGLLAFQQRADAEAFVEENEGTIMTWEDVLASWTMPMMH